MVGARRLDQQAAKERLRRVGELEELRAGQDAEEVAQQCEAAERHHRGDQRLAGRGDP